MTAISEFSVMKLLDPDVLRDPYPAYRRLREHAPVAWDADISAWVVTGYRECATVLRDTESFCSDWRRLDEPTPRSMLSIQSLDPPEHTAIRRLMLEAFRALDGDGLRRAISDGVHDLLGDAAGRASFDFVSEFAEPLALRTVTHLLGVPAPEQAWFVPVSHTVVDAMDASLRPECYEPGVAARAELAALAGTWLDAPAADGVLAHAAASGARPGIDRDILLNTLRTVLHAGFESGSRFLAAGLLALLRTPQGLRSATDAPAAGELARYAGPVQADSRGCVRDATLAGQPISKGQVVTLLIGAANRDPRAFDQPESLRLDRLPNHHLGFGRGAHACLGTALALQLAEVTFTVLGQRYPEARLAAEPQFRPNATLRGLERLEVTLRPARREKAARRTAGSHGSLPAAALARR
jgi:cytochrome P450